MRLLFSLKMARCKVKWLKDILYKLIRNVCSARCDLEVGDVNERCVESGFAGRKQQEQRGVRRFQLCGGKVAQALVRQAWDCAENSCSDFRGSFTLQLLVPAL